MRRAGVRRVLLATLGLNVLVSAGKVVVGKLTGSLAMVADGFHSMVDGLNNVAGLIVTGFAYAPPTGTTSVTLTLQRVTPSGGATVSPIRLVDGCGTWLTFVGGGPDAFR